MSGGLCELGVMIVGVGGGCDAGRVVVLIVGYRLRGGEVVRGIGGVMGER